VKDWKPREIVFAWALLTLAAVLALLIQMAWQNRTMLNSRAVIQNISARASAEDRPWTLEEKELFNLNCKPAEYDKIPHGCDPLR
jgi:hypothetical protein